MLVSCAWASEGFFPGEALVDFSKRVSRGIKSGEICFLLHLKLRKIAFFAEIFKFLPPFRYPCLWAGKISCNTMKNLV